MVRNSSYPSDEIEVWIRSLIPSLESDFTDACFDPLDVLAYAMEALRHAALQANRSFEEVEAEFGSAACAVAEHQGLFATSYHKLVIDLALFNIGTLVWAFELPGVGDAELGMFLLMLQAGTADSRRELLAFTARQIRQVLGELGEAKTWEMLNGLRMPLVDRTSFGRLIACLAQELFRVWRQRYPHGTTYQKIGNRDSEALTELQKAMSSPQASSRRRPSERKIYKAIEFIKHRQREGKGPTKGTLIAIHIGVQESTFRSNYQPELRDLGVDNDGDGYYFPDHPTEQ
jgi:hypothetical protein